MYMFNLCVITKTHTKNVNGLMCVKQLQGYMVSNVFNDLIVCER